MADMVASVPELTILTISNEGTMSTINSAISTSLRVGAPKEKENCKASATAFSTESCAWPNTMGPQELINSMYWFPSSSYKYGPFADLIKTGVPPTARKARTGELTPPGIYCCAFSKSCLLFSLIFLSLIVMLFVYSILIRIFLKYICPPNRYEMNCPAICKYSYYVLLYIGCIVWPSPLWSQMLPANLQLRPGGGGGGGGASVIDGTTHDIYVPMSTEYFYELDMSNGLD